MRILVVENDRDQLELRVALLRHAGFEVDEAATPSEAIGSAVQYNQSCVLLDLRIPSIEDGLALVRELKRITPKATVIVLSGTSQALIKNRPEMKSIDHFLHKPVRTDTLIRMLRGLG